MKNNDEKKALKKIYIDFVNQKEKVDNEIEKNCNEIKEIEVYLDSILTDENNGLRAFSPRNPINLNNEKIQENKLRKESLEEMNRDLYRERNRYCEKIESLGEILGDVTEVDLDNKDMFHVKNENHINILEVQEKERQRIAVDIHDTTIQNLTHILHMLELSSKYIDIDTIRAKLELQSVNKYVKQTIDELRDLVYDLRPMSLDDIGIEPVLDKLYQELQQKTDMNIIFDIEPDINKFILDKTDAITIYRIIKECCMNSTKHSKGKFLKLVLNHNEQHILIKIEDDGIGFNTENYENHFGLSIVRERVSLLSGIIKIEKLNKGTRIMISIPRKEENND